MKRARDVIAASPCFVRRASSCLIAMAAMSMSLVVLAAAPETPRPADARVLGPQSAQERYDAEVPESRVPEDAIDIPSLIQAPGANDRAVVMDDLKSLNIEFVEAPSGGDRGDFVSFSGSTHAEDNRVRLYAYLRESLEIYQGLPLTLGDVRFIQQDITDVYRELGYPLMAVFVPPQEVSDGVLQVQINEFALAGVDVAYEGEGGYSADAKHWTREEEIRRRAGRVMAEPILAQASLDRLIQDLNRNPFRSARMVFEPGAQVGDTRALIQIQEQRPWNAQLGYNNHGTDAAGNNRFSMGGTFGNVPVVDQTLSWNATFGDSLDEFQNYSLIYTAPNRFGHTLTVNGNYSDTASSTLPGIDSASTSWQVSTNYAVPIRATQNWELTANGIVAFKHFERESLFGGTAVGGAEFDAVIATLSGTLNIREEHASNQIVLSLNRTFEGLTDRNSNADFRQFHNSRAGTAAYEFAVLNYARVQQLDPFAESLAGWSAETQVSLQFSMDELAGADNVALGGPGTLRAYEASEVAGDRGGYLIQMLHAPAIQGSALGRIGAVVLQLRATAFVEIGTAEFDIAGRSSIYDAGFQVGIGLPKQADCTLSLAFAGDDAGRTEAGDARAYIGCGMRF